MAETIRNQIIKNLVDRYKSVEEGVDGNEFDWKVERQPPTKSDRVECRYLAIMDVGETKRRTTNMIDNRILRLLIEFHMPVKEGNEPSDMLNRALGEIIRTMGLDTTCGGLCLSIEDDGSELDTLGDEAMVASGVVVFNILFRTRMNDPTEKC